jgi:hypothetical protein
LFFKFKTEQAFSQCCFGIYKAKKIVIEKKTGENEKKIVKKRVENWLLTKLV